MAYYRSVFGDDKDIKPGWTTRWDPTHSIRIFGPPDAMAARSNIGTGMLDTGSGLQYDRGTGTPAWNYVGNATSIPDGNYIPDSMYVSTGGTYSPYINWKPKFYPPNAVQGLEWRDPLEPEGAPFDIPVKKFWGKGKLADPWFLFGKEGKLYWKVIRDGKTYTAPLALFKYDPPIEILPKPVTAPVPATVPPPVPATVAPVPLPVSLPVSAPVLPPVSQQTPNSTLVGSPLELTTQTSWEASQVSRSEAASVPAPVPVPASVPVSSPTPALVPPSFPFVRSSVPSPSGPVASRSPTVLTPTPMAPVAVEEPDSSALMLAGAALLLYLLVK